MIKAVKRSLFLSSLFTLSIFLLFLYKAVSLDILKIKGIEIKGTTELSEGDVWKISSIKSNNILRINLEGLRREILKYPWVRDAIIKRELTGRLIVHVTERVPEAIVDYGDSFYLVDGEGVIIERVKDRDGYFLPLISGIDLSGSALGEKTPSKGLSEGLVLLRFLKDSGLCYDEDLEIMAKEPEDLTINYAGRQIKIGSGDYEEKFRKLREIDKELEKKGVLASSVDLRFPSKVIVIPMAEGSL